MSLQPERHQHEQPPRELGIDRNDERTMAATGRESRCFRNRWTYDTCGMNEPVEPLDVPAEAVRRHLAEHLDGVLAGRSYQITRGGRATARLIPVDAEETSDAD